VTGAMSNDDQTSSEAPITYLLEQSPIKLSSNSTKTHRKIQLTLYMIPKEM